MKAPPMPLDVYFQMCGLPKPVLEFVFHGTRKWRFDAAWTVRCGRGALIALEIEGGIYRRRASHSSIKGILRDIEKHREAAILGWCVIRVTPDEVDSGVALELVERALTARGWVKAKDAKHGREPTGLD